MEDRAYYTAKYINDVIQMYLSFLVDGTNQLT